MKKVPLSAELGLHNFYRPNYAPHTPPEITEVKAAEDVIKMRLEFRHWRTEVKLVGSVLLARVLSGGEYSPLSWKDKWSVVGICAPQTLPKIKQELKEVADAAGWPNLEAKEDS